MVISFKGSVSLEHLMNESLWRTTARTTAGERWFHSVHNVFEDAFWPTETPYCAGCKVARLWQFYWTKMRSAVLKMIDGILNDHPMAPVIVSGFSWGAPIAMIAAAELAASNRKPDALITFGSPRLGNRAMAEHLEAIFPHSMLRLSSYNDMVTLIPPLLGDWTHSGKSLIFSHARAHRQSRVHHAVGTSSKWVVQLCPNASRQNAFQPCRSKREKTVISTLQSWFIRNKNLLLGAGGYRQGANPGRSSYYVATQYADPEQTETIVGSGALKMVRISTLMAEMLHNGSTRFSEHHPYEYLRDVPALPALLRVCLNVLNGTGQHVGEGGWGRLSHCKRSGTAIDREQCAIEELEA